MALYRRKGSVIGAPGYQVDGYHACPICNHTNLIKPTSSLKVNPSTGQPFTENSTNTDDLWSPFNNNTFPTYGSWFCVDNNHIFRTPTFSPDQSIYAGFLPEQSGVTQREF